jgi:ribosome-associated protein
MTNSTLEKKDIQKLQRAIVDGLEDVKAQDIQVFDTEHLSALFERVIIASGTSNRQTKALAGSVRDAVRDAGFPKPRIEGETNGEWIIVDCGQAVVHIMQPNFRQYYNLEELWGDKPVRLKFGSAKPAAAEAAKPEKEVKEAVKPEGNLRRSNAAKKGVAEAFPSKAQVKKTLAAKSAASRAPAKKAAAKRAPAKSASAATEQRAAPKPAAKVAVKKVTINAPAKATAKKAPAKTSAKTVAKKTPPKKTAARKA